MSDPWSRARERLGSAGLTSTPVTALLVMDDCKGNKAMRITVLDNALEGDVARVRDARSTCQRSATTWLRPNPSGSGLAAIRTHACAAGRVRPRPTRQVIPRAWCFRGGTSSTWAQSTDAHGQWLPAVACSHRLDGCPDADGSLRAQRRVDLVRGGDPQVVAPRRRRPRP
jgi:hypothetical protein